MTDNERQHLAWSQWLNTHAMALRAIEGQLKAAGQPPLAWYDLLLELERVGGEMRIGDLAERLVVERYNMTRLLDRMAGEGLIERRADPVDRRAALAVITPAGKATRAKMWPHYRAAIDSVFSDALTPADAAALTAALRKVKARLKQD
ncbi:MarR family winged helix-turn-helix transcriptional regulator [Pelagibacterium halotolerans]|uniref:MarR family winged helix-turn-helix transcriptional regulator n=1 Tax=Pelagibacterium halotolerans TaxID=531813 RepID=UPI00384B3F0A